MLFIIWIRPPAILAEKEQKKNFLGIFLESI